MSKIRIVLVDDHQLLLEGTTMALRRYDDLEVVGLATTGHEAIAQVEEHQPDVLLLDVRLPDISGIEVARVVHRRWPHIQIIAISGFDDSQYVRGLKAMGVRACLQKTLTTSELVDSIRAIAAGEAQELPGRGAPELNQHLTPREFQVLELVGRGQRNGDIAITLGLSVKAVEFHITHVLEKLDARSRSEAIVKAARMLDLPRDQQWPPQGEH